MSQPRCSLPKDTRIDCYRVRRLIGSGGFSLIYLAEDEDTGGEVVIKEFMPKKFARRDQLSVIPLDDKSADNLNRGRKLFYQEIKALAALRHPNIVKVRAFFRANNTAYMIMEYYRGKNLAAYIKQRKGKLSTSFILRVFFPLLDAMQMIHSYSYLHLDIKPSNIHLRAGSEPLLLDFGAVHQVESGRKRKSGVVTAGYSPVEQYYRGGFVGPWSDVYAIGASMRACIEGKSPPTAIERHANDKMVPASEAFGERYPFFLLQSIDWAMELDPQQRPQHAGEFLHALRYKRGRTARTSADKLAENNGGR